MILGLSTDRLRLSGVPVRANLSQESTVLNLIVSPVRSVRAKYYAYARVRIARVHMRWPMEWHVSPNTPNSPNWGFRAICGGVA